MLAAGVDDSGGVCRSPPITSTPSGRGRRSSTLRAATEAAGDAARACLTVHPEFVRDPQRWIDPTRRSACSCAATPKGSPATTTGPRAATRRRLIIDVSTTPPRRRVPGAISGNRRDPRRSNAARRSATTSRHAASARGTDFARRGAVADELRGRDRRRRGHVRPQPQHQLHERVHVQVPLLCVLARARCR